MEWSDVLKLIASVMGSLGGASVIIIAVLKRSSDIMADALSKKYQHILDEKLEAHKAILESKTYITKTKFDAEFDLYRSLSKVFFDAVKAVSIMIPVGLAKYPLDKDAREKFEHAQYTDALQSTVLAQDTLKSNIPFISKELYDLYADILVDCNIQLNVFEERWDRGLIGHTFGESTLTGEDYKRTKTISDKFDLLNKQVRDYIATLDVLE